MYHEKLVTGLFLSMILIGAATAATICPFPTLKPTELQHVSFDGSILNGGVVNGALFVSQSTLATVSGNVTGYMSTEKDALASAEEILYSDEYSFGSDLFASESGISITNGGGTYQESGMYDYSNKINPMYCERAFSEVKMSITDGAFGSTLNMTGMSTSILNHNSAIQGTGSFSGNAYYNIMEGYNQTISGTLSGYDRVSMVGTMEFARNVHFKSIKP